MRGEGVESVGIVLTNLKKGAMMLHYSTENKNKHQHNDSTDYDQDYLYAILPARKPSLKKLNAQDRAMLDDDINALRRHFKKSNRRLKRTIHYENWVKHMPQKEQRYIASQLHMNHA